MAAMLPSLESFVKGVFATAAGLSTLGAGLLYYGQNYLIYPAAFPQGVEMPAVATPSSSGMPYEDLRLKCPDGVTIAAYLMVQRKHVEQGSVTKVSKQETDEEFASRRPTVIMFHGNGGNYGHRVPLAKIFYVKLRCNVLMLSYRGYANSDGSPSEKGIRLDAQASLDYLTAHPQLSKTPIILYGQSIGGAVAIDLASRNPTTIRALILENTFLSIPLLIPSVLPLLARVAFLCHQKWDSAARIARIPRTTPLLFLGGAKDTVVPRAHMQALWRLACRRGLARADGPEGDAADRELEERAQREGNRYVEFENGTHNETCALRGYWTAVAQFIAGLRPRDAARPVQDGT